MHSVIGSVAENVLQNHHLVVPVVFVLSSIPTNTGTPVQHSLLVASISWALIWLPAAFRTRTGLADAVNTKNTTGWAAGAFLALGQICDRAAGTREAIWWTKALLPLLVTLIPENASWASSGASSSSTVDEYKSESNAESRTQLKSFRLLIIGTISAIIALGTPYSTPQTLVLGLCGAFFSATGLVLFETAIRSRTEDAARRGFMSANGSFSRSTLLEQAHSSEGSPIPVLRDVACVMAMMCGTASCLMEPTRISWGLKFQKVEGNWRGVQKKEDFWLWLSIVFFHVMKNSTLFVLLLRQGVMTASSFLLFSYLSAKLIINASFSSVWFTVLVAGATLLSPFTSSTADLRTSLRRLRPIFLAVAGLSILVSIVLKGFLSSDRISFMSKSSLRLQINSPATPLQPIPLDLNIGHPAEQLIQSAEDDFLRLLGKQSKSLAGAVQEYRRRNGINPPPHFDKWYEFAKRSGVQLIDEFDTINESLLPFWGLKPSTIRTRTRLALGSKENALVGITIRDGSVVKTEGGSEWQQNSTVGMMKEFIQYLPDMDLAFNIHDEPRVVVPHDQLSALIEKAKDKIASIAGRSQTPKMQFSARPADLNDGTRFVEAPFTRFNRFAHQATWTHSRLSCSPLSQARNYEEEPADNLTSYSAGALGFVYNVTAFSDICNSPSLSYTFGFFDRPNAFNIIQELTPIFSQSKVSSFQDILYPSPWYWSTKVVYEPERDTTWQNKTNSLYWRGSTTGGFSRDGGWRRQHRQHIVKRLNAPDKAKILLNKGQETAPVYEVFEVPRKDFKAAIDVKFSHVGQCDEVDCDAQKEFFDVQERVDGQDAWKYKHLLDMDGNAFSGRFYAFLKSKSLTYKMAIFREWHAEWLRPWLHYIPISLDGGEHLELVRWFGGIDERNGEGDGNGGSLGEKRARDIAERSTEWADKVLRNVDMEVWFFRLLLEYGRVIDDDRDSIGYSGP